MKKMEVKKSGALKGTISVPADKSVSHRAVMLSSLAEGKTHIKNFLLSEDCLHTLKAFESMGISSSLTGADLEIEGKGIYGLKKPKGNLYVGNSGTTIRLMLGILSAQNFETVLEGDPSLNNRPMRRVIAPLRMMGADISAREDNFAPIIVKGVPLKAISYKPEIASAQVKSAVLLAGLYAKGVTDVYEKIETRDHSERMLKLFSADIKKEGLKVSISSSKLISPGVIEIPADFSSAAFFIAAAVIVPDSEIVIKQVGINPGRTGFLKVLYSMGACIELENQKEVSGEPRADMRIKFKRPLKGVNIDARDIPAMIDELPIMMIVAAQAQGETFIKGAGELRVKETDRINSMVVNLKKMGADIKVIENDILIKGPVALKGAVIDSFGDHRTAMSFAVAGLIAEGKTIINDTECIQTSFPGFQDILESII
ncbi:MAG: 3-phosphoshikimate 1-carboxyvinyltransferase [Candidatus Omnitrophota bacterium]